MSSIISTPPFLAQQSGSFTAWRYCGVLVPDPAGVPDELVEVLAPLEELLPEPLPDVAPLGGGAACSGLSTGVAAGSARVAAGMVESPASGKEVAGAAMMVLGVPSIIGDCADGNGLRMGRLAGICVSPALTGGKIG